jgi:hypothetical protein
MRIISTICTEVLVLAVLLPGQTSRNALPPIPPPTAAPPTIPARVVEVAAPSLALVLVGQTPGQATVSVATAFTIREDGVLLTSLHAVKDANLVQVRLTNGDIFNDVQLLGVDVQRDLAAIKIGATGLRPLPLAGPAPIASGTLVATISYSGTTSWAATDAHILGYGADGQNIQFSPAVSHGSTGGIILDIQGRGVGFILGGESLSAAVPLVGAGQLATAPSSKHFGNGRGLVPPGVTLAAAQTVNQPQPVATPDAPEKSEILTPSTDRDALLRSIKTMYVDAHRAKYFASDQMKAALGSNKDFKALNIRIVDDPKLADTILDVGYTFAWDYPFELKHQNTSIVLVSGTGYGPFSGPLGAASVAREFSKAAKPYRTASKTQK